jgi:hypothetical protein
MKPKKAMEEDLMKFLLWIAFFLIMMAGIYALVNSLIG